MNKIHSKVWNKDLGQLVVASELASSDSAGVTGGGVIGAARKTGLAAALALLGIVGTTWLLPASTAMAADALCYDASGNPVGTASGSGDEVACGEGAVASGVNAIAIGKGASAVGDFSIALGYLAGLGSTGSNNFAVGTVAGNNVSSNGNTAVGYGAGTNVSAVSTSTVDPYPAIRGQNVAVGATAGNGVAGNYNNAMGERAGRTVDGNGNTAIGSLAGNQVTGSLNIAIGTQAGFVVKGDVNTAVGNFAGSNVTGGRNSAFGNGAGSNVTGNYNVAMGANAGANVAANNTISVGTNSGASGAISVAIGFNAASAGNNAVALGRVAIASSGNAVAIGYGAASTGSDAVALGRSSVASQADAIAIGNGAQANGSRSISVGAGNIVNGAGSGAFGDPNTVNGSGSYAIGNSNTIDADNAFVLGNNVVVAAGLDGAVGLGNNTTVDASTVASYQPIGGTAVIGTAIGANVVSVGSAGNERRLTNVAAGGALTDAVNVSQLQALASIMAANTTKYFSVNSTGGGNENNDGATGADAIAVGKDATATGDNSLAIGLGATADDANSVALGAGSATAAAVGTAGTIIRGENYSFAGTVPVGTVSVGSVGNERTITNVAAGRLDAASTDAVNGSQLFATNSAIDKIAVVAGAGWNLTAQGSNGSNVAPGDTVDLNNGDGNIVVSKTAADDDVTFDLADDLNVASSVTVGDTVITTNGVAIGTDVVLGRTGLVISGGPSVTTAGIDAGSLAITNVAAGVAPTDAVNVSQLMGTVGASKAKYYSVNSTGGGNENNDGATGVDAIASGKDATAGGANAVAIGYQSMAGGVGSFAGGHLATALAAGSVSVGDGARVGAGSNGAVALGAGASVTGADGSVAIGDGATATHANSIALGAGSATTVGAQAGYNAAYVGSSSSAGELNIGNRTITGVAPGSSGTDAVNVDQLNGGVDYAIDQSKNYTDTQINQVNTSITNLDNRVTNIQGDITDIQGDVLDIQGDITSIDARVTTLEGKQGSKYYSVNSTGGGNANNDGATGADAIAIGKDASATATDSIAIGNGATATHGNSIALGAGSATTVGAQTDYNAAYVGTSTSSGEMNVGNRTITGVAPGIAGTDAVNVNQLNGGVNYAINQANSYTDSRIDNLYGDVWDMRRGYRGATSSAMAMAGLPQAYLPGKSMLAVGFGGYQGEYGMAVGLSGITENGRYVYKAQASGNTARDFGFSVGAGFQW